MGLAGDVRALAHKAKMPLTAGLAHLREYTPRPTHFFGAWDSREAALATLPEQVRSGYDSDGVAEVSFEQMTAVMLWDYPVLFWLNRLLAKGGTVLDAGGHMGTKYIAFRDRIDLSQITWTVSDLPAIVAAGRKAQSEGRVPAEIRFSDDPASTEPCDLLLASGLLQYLDISFSDFVAGLPERPEHILLNKVALREGAPVVTLERVGPTRVPYQIRSRQVFEAEIAQMGYQIEDRWSISQLSHVIPSHPWLGPSESCGFALRRR